MPGVAWSRRVRTGTVWRGGVEDGVDLPDVGVRVHLCPQLGAVADWDRAEFPGEFFVARSRGADDGGALGQGQLGGDEADRAAAAEDQQRLDGGDAQLPEGADGSFPPRQAVLPRRPS
jgi:hypothetical protein